MLTSPLLGHKTSAVVRVRKIVTKFCANTTLWTNLFILNVIIFIILLLSLKHSNEKINKFVNEDSIKHENPANDSLPVYEITKIIVENVTTLSTNKQQKQQTIRTTLGTTKLIKLALGTAEDINYKKVVNKEETFQEIAVQRINNVEDVELENNEELPTMSYFGTTNESDICVGSDEKRCTPKLQRSRTLFTVN